jgi:paraquat-inducible protein B
MSTTDYNSNDRLVLQLSAQQQQLQQMNESVSLLLERLHEQPTQPNLTPQLDQLNQNLAALNDTMSSMQKEWARRDPRESLDAVKERLSKLEERSESTRTTLKEQRDLLKEHLSAKMLGIQYGSIAVLSSLLTVMAVNWMPVGLQQTQAQLNALRYENQLLTARLIRMEKHLGVPTK